MSNQLTFWEDIPAPEEKITKHRLELETDFWKDNLSPKVFGAHIGQDEDTICNKIEKGQIKAINLNHGGIKARYAIPITELDKFKPDEYRGVYKHLRD